MAEWEVIEGHEGRAPQGTKPRLKAEGTQKLEKMCYQHWELVTFAGGGVRLTLLGVSWDSAIHSPAPHKPVGRGKTPSSPPPPGWRILLGEGQAGFRECPGLQGPSRAALSYRWFLLFSIFLEFSPSPTSLSCWLGLLLLSDPDVGPPKAGSSSWGPPVSPLSRGAGFFLLVLKGFSAESPRLFENSLLSTRGTRANAASSEMKFCSASCSWVSSWASRWSMTLAFRLRASRRLRWCAVN